jgi:hypothetical protein
VHHVQEQNQTKKHRPHTVGLGNQRSCQNDRREKISQTYDSLIGNGPKGLQIKHSVVELANTAHPVIAAVEFAPERLHVIFGMDHNARDWICAMRWRAAQFSREEHFQAPFFQR